MVISGTLNEAQAPVEKVADLTLKCLHECVPKDVPGIVFLSGGQSNELATQHLNEMNKKRKRSSMEFKLFIWKSTPTTVLK